MKFDYIICNPPYSIGGKVVSAVKDYAVLTTTNYSFYYGYEYDTKECECGETEEIWGFEVNGNNGKLFGISADDMKKIKDCPDIWDCEAMLLFGIGLFINEVTIDLIKKVGSEE